MTGKRTCVDYEDKKKMKHQDVAISLLIQIVIIYPGGSLSLMFSLRENSRANEPEETTSHSIMNEPRSTEQPETRAGSNNSDAVSESALTDRLFQNYDKRARPVKSADKSVVVTVDLYPIITEQLVS